MSQQRALANKEREVQAKRLNRFGRACVVAFATILSFTAIALLALDKLYSPETFVIDQLKIKGTFRYLQPEDIEKVIGTEALTNFFSIKLVEVKQRVESLPWVRHADIRREWPNTLVVNIEEHIPVMRWKSENWVTSTGKVIDLPNEILLQNVISLDANETDSLLAVGTAFRWKKKLLEDQLELRKLKLTTSRAWTITLYHEPTDAEFDLLLGRDEVESRLMRFRKLFKQEFSQADSKIVRVDARYPDGLAIKTNQTKKTAFSERHALTVAATYSAVGSGAFTR